MQRYPPKPMTPFDEIVTNQKLQFMKILLPFFPINFIKTFAFYIKFIELQNTLLHFPHIINQLSSITQIQSSDILEEIRPYMNSQDINSIESILSMLDMIKMILNT